MQRETRQWSRRYSSPPRLRGLVEDDDACPLSSCSSSSPSGLTFILLPLHASSNPPPAFLIEMSVSASFQHSLMPSVSPSFAADYAASSVSSTLCESPPLFSLHPRRETSGSEVSDKFTRSGNSAETYLVPFLAFGPSPGPPTTGSLPASCSGTERHRDRPALVPQSSASFERSRMSQESDLSSGVHFDLLSASFSGDLESLKNLNVSPVACGRSASGASGGRAEGGSEGDTEDTREAGGEADSRNGEATDLRQKVQLLSEEGNMPWAQTCHQTKVHTRQTVALSVQNVNLSLLLPALFEGSHRSGDLAGLSRGSYGVRYSRSEGQRRRTTDASQWELLSGFVRDRDPVSVSLKPSEGGKALSLQSEGATLSSRHGPRTVGRPRTRDSSTRAKEAEPEAKREKAPEPPPGFPQMDETLRERLSTVGGNGLDRQCFSLGAISGPTHLTLISFPASFKSKLKVPVSTLDFCQEQQTASAEDLPLPSLSVATSRVLREVLVGKRQRQWRVGFSTTMGRKISSPRETVNQMRQTGEKSTDAKRGESENVATCLPERGRRSGHATSENLRHSGPEARKAHSHERGVGTGKEGNASRKDQGRDAEGSETTLGSLRRQQTDTEGMENIQSAPNSSPLSNDPHSTHSALIANLVVHPIMMNITSEAVGYLGTLAFLASGFLTFLSTLHPPPFSPPLRSSRPFASRCRPLPSGMLTSLPALQTSSAATVKPLERRLSSAAEAPASACALPFASSLRRPVPRKAFRPEGSGTSLLLPASRTGSSLTSPLSFVSIPEDFLDEARARKAAKRTSRQSRLQAPKIDGGTSVAHSRCLEECVENWKAAVENLGNASRQGSLREDSKLAFSPTTRTLVSDRLLDQRSVADCCTPPRGRTAANDKCADTATSSFASVKSPLEAVWAAVGALVFNLEVSITVESVKVKYVAVHLTVEDVNFHLRKTDPFLFSAPATWLFYARRSEYLRLHLSRPLSLPLRAVDPWPRAPASRLPRQSARRLVSPSISPRRRQETRDPASVSSGALVPLAASSGASVSRRPGGDRHTEEPSIGENDLVGFSTCALQSSSPAEKRAVTGGKRRTLSSFLAPLSVTGLRRTGCREKDVAVGEDASSQNAERRSKREMHGARNYQEEARAWESEPRDRRQDEDLEEDANRVGDLQATFQMTVAVEMFRRSMMAVESVVEPCQLTVQLTYTSPWLQSPTETVGQEHPQSSAGCPLSRGPPETTACRASPLASPHFRITWSPFPEEVKRAKRRRRRGQRGRAQETDEGNSRWFEDPGPPAGLRLALHLTWINLTVAPVVMDALMETTDSVEEQLATFLKVVTRFYLPPGWLPTPVDERSFPSSPSPPEAAVALPSSCTTPKTHDFSSSTTSQPPHLTQYSFSQLSPSFVTVALSNFCSLIAATFGRESEETGGKAVAEDEGGAERDEDRLFRESDEEWRETCGQRAKGDPAEDSAEGLKNEDEESRLRPKQSERIRETAADLGRPEASEQRRLDGEREVKVQTRSQEGRHAEASNRGGDIVGDTQPKLWNLTGQPLAVRLTALRRLPARGRMQPHRPLCPASSSSHSWRSSGTKGSSSSFSPSSSSVSPASASEAFASGVEETDYSEDAGEFTGSSSTSSISGCPEEERTTERRTRRQRSRWPSTRLRGKRGKRNWKAKRERKEREEMFDLPSSQSLSLASTSSAESARRPREWLNRSGGKRRGYLADLARATPHCSDSNGQASSSFQPTRRGKKKRDRGTENEIRKANGEDEMPCSSTVSLDVDSCDFFYEWKVVESGQSICLPQDEEAQPLPVGLRLSFLGSVFHLDDLSISSSRTELRYIPLSLSFHRATPPATPRERRKNRENEGRAKHKQFNVFLSSVVSVRNSSTVPVLIFPHPFVAELDPPPAPLPLRAGRLSPSSSSVSTFSSATEASSEGSFASVCSFVDGNEGRTSLDHSSSWRRTCSNVPSSVEQTRQARKHDDCGEATAEVTPGRRANRSPRRRSSSERSPHSAPAFVSSCSASSSLSSSSSGAFSMELSRGELAFAPAARARLAPLEVLPEGGQVHVPLTWLLPRGMVMKGVLDQRRERAKPARQTSSQPPSNEASGRPPSRPPSHHTFPSSCCALSSLDEQCSGEEKPPTEDGQSEVIEGSFLAEEDWETWRCNAETEPFLVVPSGTLVAAVRGAVRAEAAERERMQERCSAGTQGRRVTVWTQNSGGNGRDTPGVGIRGPGASQLLQRRRTSARGARANEDEDDRDNGAGGAEGEGTHEGKGDKRRNEEMATSQRRADTPGEKCGGKKAGRGEVEETCRKETEAHKADKGEPGEHKRQDQGELCSIPRAASEWLLEKQELPNPTDKHLSRLLVKAYRYLYSLARSLGAQPLLPAANFRRLTESFNCSVAAYSMKPHILEFLHPSDACTFLETFWRHQTSWGRDRSTVARLVQRPTLFKHERERRHPVSRREELAPDDDTTWQWREAYPKPVDAGGKPTGAEQSGQDLRPRWEKKGLEDAEEAGRRGGGSGEGRRPQGNQKQMRFLDQVDDEHAVASQSLREGEERQFDAADGQANPLRGRQSRSPPGERYPKKRDKDSPRRAGISLSFFRQNPLMPEETGTINATQLALAVTVYGKKLRHFFTETEPLYFQIALEAPLQIGNRLFEPLNVALNAPPSSPLPVLRQVHRLPASNRNSSVAGLPRERQSLRTSLFSVPPSPYHGQCSPSSRRPRLGRQMERRVSVSPSRLSKRGRGGQTTRHRRSLSLPDSLFLHVPDKHESRLKGGTGNPPLSPLSPPPSSRRSADVSGLFSPGFPSVLSVPFSVSPVLSLRAGEDVQIEEACQVFSLEFSFSSSITHFTYVYRSKTLGINRPDASSPAVPSCFVLPLLDSTISLHRSEIVQPDGFVLPPDHPLFRFAAALEPEEVTVCAETVAGCAVTPGGASAVSVLRRRQGERSPWRLAPTATEANRDRECGNRAWPRETSERRGIGDSWQNVSESRNVMPGVKEASTNVSNERPSTRTADSPAALTASRGLASRPRSTLLLAMTNEEELKLAERITFLEEAAALGSHTYTWETGVRTVRLYSPYVVVNRHPSPLSVSWPRQLPQRLDPFAWRLLSPPSGGPSTRGASGRRKKELIFGLAPVNRLSSLLALSQLTLPSLSRFQAADESPRRSPSADGAAGAHGAELRTRPHRAQHEANPDEKAADARELEWSAPQKDAKDAETRDSAQGFSVDTVGRTGQVVIPRFQLKPGKGKRALGDRRAFWASLRGPSGKEEVYMEGGGDQETLKAHWLGITVSLAPPPFLRTKIVNVYSRFTLVNSLETHIWIREANEDTETAFLHLAPGQKQTFHPQRVGPNGTPSFQFSLFNPLLASGTSEATAALSTVKRTTGGRDEDIFNACQSLKEQTGPSTSTASADLPHPPRSTSPVPSFFPCSSFSAEGQPTESTLKRLACSAQSRHIWSAELRLTAVASHQMRVLSPSVAASSAPSSVSVSAGASEPVGSTPLAPGAPPLSVPRPGPASARSRAVGKVYTIVQVDIRAVERAALFVCFEKPEKSEYLLVNASRRLIYFRQVLGASRRGFGPSCRRDMKELLYPGAQVEYAWQDPTRRGKKLRFSVLDSNGQEVHCTCDIARVKAHPPLPLSGGRDCLFLTTQVSRGRRIVLLTDLASRWGSRTHPLDLAHLHIRKAPSDSSEERRRRRVNGHFRSPTGRGRRTEEAERSTRGCHLAQRGGRRSRRARGAPAKRRLKTFLRSQKALRVDATRRSGQAKEALSVTESEELVMGENEGQRRGAAEGSKDSDALRNASGQGTKKGGRGEESREASTPTGAQEGTQEGIASSHDQGAGGKAREEIEHSEARKMLEGMSEEEDAFSSWKKISRSKSWGRGHVSRRLCEAFLKKLSHLENTGRSRVPQCSTVFVITGRHQHRRDHPPRVWRPRVHRRRAAAWSDEERERGAKEGDAHEDISHFEGSSEFTVHHVGTLSLEDYSPTEGGSADMKASREAQSKAEDHQREVTSSEEKNEQTETPDSVETPPFASLDDLAKCLPKRPSFLSEAPNASQTSGTVEKARQIGGIAQLKEERGALSQGRESFRGSGPQSGEEDGATTDVYEGVNEDWISASSFLSSSSGPLTREEDGEHARGLWRPSTVAQPFAQSSVDFKRSRKTFLPIFFGQKRRHNPHRTGHLWSTSPVSSSGSLSTPSRRSYFKKLRLSEWQRTRGGIRDPRPRMRFARSANSALPGVSPDSPPKKSNFLLGSAEDLGNSQESISPIAISSGHARWRTSPLSLTRKRNGQPRRRFAASWREHDEHAESDEAFLCDGRRQEGPLVSPTDPEAERESSALSSPKLSEVEIVVSLVLDGLGISLVDSGPQELSYVALSGAVGAARRLPASAASLHATEEGGGTLHVDYRLAIRNLQIDNNISGAYSSTIMRLATQEERLRHWGAQDKRSLVPGEGVISTAKATTLVEASLREFRLSQDDPEAENVFFRVQFGGQWTSEATLLQYFECTLAPLSVHIEIDTTFELVRYILRFLKWRNLYFRSLQSRSVLAIRQAALGDPLSDGFLRFRACPDPPVCVSSQTFSKKPFYIQTFCIRPIKILVSARAPRLHKRRLQADRDVMVLRQLQLVAGTVTDVTNVPVKFRLVFQKSVFNTMEHFTEQLSTVYIQQGIRQAHKLVASIDVLGNPLNVLSNVSAGTRALFLDRIHKKPVSDGPSERLNPWVVCARLSRGLLADVLDGLSSIFAGLFQLFETLRLVDGDDLLGMWPSHLRVNRPTLECPDSLAEGIFRGVLVFFQLLVSSLFALVLYPQQGYTRRALPGLQACGARLSFEGEVDETKTRTKFLFFLLGLLYGFSSLFFGVLGAVLLLLHSFTAGVCAVLQRLPHIAAIRPPRAFSDSFSVQPFHFHVSQASDVQQKGIALKTRASVQPVIFACPLPKDGVQGLDRRGEEAKRQRSSRDGAGNCMHERANKTESDLRITRWWHSRLWDTKVADTGKTDPGAFRLETGRRQRVEVEGEELEVKTQESHRISSTPREGKSLKYNSRIDYIGATRDLLFYAKDGTIKWVCRRTDVASVQVKASQQFMSALSAASRMGPGGGGFGGGDRRDRMRFRLAQQELQDGRKRAAADRFFSNLFASIRCQKRCARPSLIFNFQGSPRSGETARCPPLRPGQVSVAPSVGDASDELLESQPCCRSSCDSLFEDVTRHAAVEKGHLLSQPQIPPSFSPLPHCGASDSEAATLTGECFRSLGNLGALGQVNGSLPLFLVHVRVRNALQVSAEALSDPQKAYALYAQHAGRGGTAETVERPERHERRSKGRGGEGRDRKDEATRELAEPLGRIPRGIRGQEDFRGADVDKRRRDTHGKMLVVGAGGRDEKLDGEPAKREETLWKWRKGACRQKWKAELEGRDESRDRSTRDCARVGHNDSGREQGCPSGACELDSERGEGEAPRGGQKASKSDFSETSAMRRKGAEKGKKGRRCRDSSREARRSSSVRGVVVKQTRRERVQDQCEATIGFLPVLDRLEQGREEEETAEDAEGAGGRETDAETLRREPVSRSRSVLLSWGRECRGYFSACVKYLLSLREETGERKQTENTPRAVVPLTSVDIREGPFAETLAAGEGLEVDQRANGDRTHSDATGGGEGLNVLRAIHTLWHTVVSAGRRAYQCILRRRTPLPPSFVLFEIQTRDWDSAARAFDTLASCMHPPQR
ncbi:UNVERIFIED_CONTAM: transmembrane protein, putative [Hammondia hammondi]|eukprot:XP_008886374.1 transmembrane protein, putative [Hammondia hammondi]